MFQFLLERIRTILNTGCRASNCNHIQIHLHLIIKTAGIVLAGSPKINGTNDIARQMQPMSQEEASIGEIEWRR
jgi:hypothetical protein